MSCCSVPPCGSSDAHAAALGCVLKVKCNCVSVGCCGRRAGFLVRRASPRAAKHTAQQLQEQRRDDTWPTHELSSLHVTSAPQACTLHQRLKLRLASDHSSQTLRSMLDYEGTQACQQLRAVQALACIIGCAVPEQRCLCTALDAVPAKPRAHVLRSQARPAPRDRQKHAHPAIDGLHNP